MKNLSNADNNHEKTMIIPLFIMNRGCPHRCIFCNQTISSGNDPTKIDINFFDTIINSYLNSNLKKTKKAQIAFYGGNFTGLSPDYQEELLSWANFYVRKGLVQSLRISTRPDYISEDILKMLKKYNVATIELGAQSFVDEVLEYAQRGHDATCIEQAMILLKKYSFRSSLHLMAGLPKDTKEGFIFSLKKTAELKPDMARINPTLVLKDTFLARKYCDGLYSPLPLSDAVDLCSLAFEILSAAGIRIIRFGLHLTDEMKKDGAVLAGPIHHSFGSLVLSSFFYRRAATLLKNIPQSVTKIHFKVSPAEISSFRGFNNCNISAIQSHYPQTKITIETSLTLMRGDISFSADAPGFGSTNIYKQDDYPQMEAL